VNTEQNEVGLTVSEEAYVHPVMSATSYFRSFNEWKRSWDSLPQLELKFGLLHALTLNGDCWSMPKTTLFLFDVADGYLRGDFEHSRDSNTAYMPPGGYKAESFFLIRRKIACKAFSILCEHVFQKRWVHYANNIKICEKMLWFLRLADMKNSLDVYNLKAGQTNHPFPVFENFVLEFAERIWHPYIGQNRDGSCWSKKHLELFESNKFLSVFWLYELGKIDTLHGRELGDELLAQIESTLLSQRYSLPRRHEVWGDEYRKPETVYEILLDASGSKLARFLLAYKARVKQISRLKSERQKLQKEKVEERKREELAQIAREKAELQKREKELAQR